MAQNNSGKYKVFENGSILYGPSGLGQNLNDDLQKRIADEIDEFLKAMVGDGVFTGSWVTSAGAGLSVNISAGGGVIEGQIVKSSGTVAVSSLPSSTSGIVIYVTAASPWSSTLKGWQMAANWKNSPVSAGQLHIATVATDGASVTSVIDARYVLTSVQALTQQKNSRAVAAAFGVI